MSVLDPQDVGSAVIDRMEIETAHRVMSRFM